MFQYTVIVVKQCKWLTFCGMFSKTVKKETDKLYKENVHIN